MDKPGPAPDPASPAAPPPAAPDAPATPLTAPTAPAPEPVPAAAAPAPEAPPKAADPWSPPPRRGLFGPRGPVSPEQRVAGRLRGIGFACIVLASLLLFQMGPFLITAINNPAFFEDQVRAAGPNISGGDLEMQFEPADAAWNVTLLSYANQTLIETKATDGSGKVHFNTLEHALATVEATRPGASVRGDVFVPAGGTTLVKVAQGDTSDWLGDPPRIPGQILALYSVLAVSLLLAGVGGAAMVLRKWRPLAMTGTLALAAGGIYLAMTGGGGLLFGVIMVGLGVWGFITVRRNAQAFGPPTAPAT